MMKSIFLISVIITIWTCIVEGHFHTAFSQEDECQSKDTFTQKWMSKISDSQLIQFLSIPGTHDTMALFGGEQFQCQSMKLEKQLESGIRALDIRCRHVNDRFLIHHSFVYLNSEFSDVLETCAKFLSQNPSEFILMRVKQEWFPMNNSRDFESTFNEYYDLYQDYIWQYTNSDYIQPTLREVRGKIVILQDFDSNTFKYGWDFKSSKLQDDFKLITIWDLYSKWIKIKNHLYLANQSNIEQTIYSAQPPIFINFLSASVGVKPYFAASGHAYWGTNSSRLYFGMVNALFDEQYEDFPRILCLFGNLFCSVLFEGTNILTYELLQKEPFSFVGILFADFPGCGLIKEIINVNYRFKLTR